MSGSFTVMQPLLVSFSPGAIFLLLNFKNNCLHMRKCISLGTAVLFILSLKAQQDRTFISAQVRTGTHPVVQLSSPKRISFSLPSNAVLHEFQDGSRLFSASSKHSKLNGSWQSWYSAGHLCDSGRLVNNLPDGEWKFWDEQGRLAAVRNYHAEKFLRVIEEIERFHPKRSFYTIAALSRQNKHTALHYLSSAYSFPPAEPKTPFSSLRELVRSNTSGAGLYQPVFENCLQDGLYMNFFVNGQARDSGYYKDGLRTGKWVHRDAAGSSWWEGAYQDGTRVKEWKHYNNHGKLIEIAIYRKGEISWRKTFNN